MSGTTYGLRKQPETGILHGPHTAGSYTAVKDVGFRSFDSNGIPRSMPRFVEVKFQLQVGMKLEQVGHIAREELELVEAWYSNVVNSSANVTATIKKAASGTAMGSGTELVSAIDLDTDVTANTPLNKTAGIAGAAGGAARRVPVGTSVGIDVSGDPTALEGGLYHLYFRVVE